MTKSVFVLIGICFALGCNSGQSSNYIEDYYPHMYQGDLAFLKEDYTIAYQSLKKAINNLPPLNMPPYYELEKLLKAAIILGKEQEALNYLKPLIQKGYEFKTFEEDAIISKLSKHSQWKKIKEEYPVMRQAYLDKIDLNLRKEIIEMKSKDQMYRGRGDAHNFIAQQDSLDTLIQLRLVQIFENHGYPNLQVIGNQTVDGVYNLGIGAILLHTPDSLRLHYFIPKLEEFVKAGRCESEVLGTVIDQYHLKKEGQQIYGTFQNGEGGLASVKNEVEMNTRRKEIGLPPIEMTLERERIIKEIYGW